uniref:Uncharacterized protein n=1 Tax=Loxodonta africana TaxID=9785 RepID=G3U547_LOXAF
GRKPPAKEGGLRTAGGAEPQTDGALSAQGLRSRDAVRPISSIRLRGISAVQSHRICIPRICFVSGWVESPNKETTLLAHILGGLRPLAGRVLQRSTPVLVPF